jgi:hypothetical protein
LLEWLLDGRSGLNSDLGVSLGRCSLSSLP